MTDKVTWDDRLAVTQAELPDGYTITEGRAENRQRQWTLVAPDGTEVITKVADRESKARSLIELAWEHSLGIME